MGCSLVALSLAGRRLPCCSVLTQPVLWVGTRLGSSSSYDDTSYTELGPIFMTYFILDSLPEAPMAMPSYWRL